MTTNTNVAAEALVLVDVRNGVATLHQEHAVLADRRLPDDMGNGCRLRRGGGE